MKKFFIFLLTIGTTINIYSHTPFEPNSSLQTPSEIIEEIINFKNKIKEESEIIVDKHYVEEIREAEQLIAQLYKHIDNLERFILYRELQSLTGLTEDNEEFKKI